MDAVRDAQEHVQVVVKIHVAFHVEQAAKPRAQDSVLDVEIHVVLDARLRALQHAMENVCPHAVENVDITAVMLV